MPSIVNCRPCKQCAYMPAVACEDQPKLGTPPAVVVPYNVWHPLTGITYFKYSGYCYSVDPAGTSRIRTPLEKIAYTLGGTFEDCGTGEDGCAYVPEEEEPDPAPPPCAGCSNQCLYCNDAGQCVHISNLCGDPRYRDYHLGLDECIKRMAKDHPTCFGTGGVPGPPEPKGWHATLCTGQSTTGAYDVWVVNAPDGTSIFRYGAWCYEVTKPPGDEGTTVPTGKPKVSVTQSFDTCEECIGGIPASFCAYQILPPGTRWPYIRYHQRPTGIITVRIDGLCWQFNGASASSPIPAGANIVTVSNQFDNCAVCVRGVIAELCKVEVTDPVTEEVTEREQPQFRKAPKLWVPDAYVKEDISVWKYKGWCYKSDPEAARVIKPADATVHFGVDQFNHDCQNCVCADPQSVNGVKAIPCPGQADAYKAVDLWVAWEDLPEEVTFFTHGKICYSIDPDGELTRMPAGAIIYYPDGQYESCGDCIANRVSDPDNPPTDPDNPDPDPDNPGDPGGPCIPVGDPPAPCNENPPGDPDEPPDPTVPTDPGGPPFPPPDASSNSYQLYTCDEEGVTASDEWIACRDADGNPNGLAGRYIVYKDACYWVSNVQSTSLAPQYVGAVYIECQQCADTNVDCNCPRLAFATGLIDSTDPVWFGVFPAGTYTIQYIFGALRFGFPDDKTQVNDYYESEHGYKIVSADEATPTVTTELADAPGYTGDECHDQQCVEELGNCSQAVVSHPGGLLGIQLADDPLNDNAIDEDHVNPSAPAFKLCEGGTPPGPCPEEVSGEIDVTFGWPSGGVGNECELIATTFITLLPDGDHWIWVHEISESTLATITCTEDEWILEFSDSTACAGVSFVFTKPRSGESRPSAGGWTFVSEAHECCIPFGTPTATSD